jgi:hypothetical protein
MAGFIERRKHPRFTVNFMAFLTTAEGVDRGTAVDISRGGAFTAIAGEYSVEDLVEIRVFPPGDSEGEAITLIGHVRRRQSEPKAGIGIEFLKGASGDMDRLEKYLRIPSSLRRINDRKN